jgi:DNA polymerase-3 subunit chi
VTEVAFYHLTRSPLEQALPQLLEMCLKREMRVLVHSGNGDRLQWLDDKLWNYAKDEFLPHDQVGGDFDAEQPILLTSDGANINKANVLMLVDGARPDLTAIKEYDRVCLLFDGNSEGAVNDARQDWKTISSANMSAVYWSQAEGAWAKKAESKSTG